MKSPIIEKYISGEITDEDIDKMVERWHTSGGNKVSLHEYLGFSREDYAKWVINASWLSELKQASQEAAMQSIVKMYLNGEISDKNINKWLEEEAVQWDGGDGSVQLWQHLGFNTEDDYRKWTANSSFMQTLKNENDKSKLAAN